MKINEFIESFTIVPMRDIEPFFKLTKKVELAAQGHKGCFNCEDELNSRWLPSAAWTGVQHCGKCKHLNVVYYADRMSGVYVDRVECYTEKE